MANRLQLRRGTAAEWAAVNPVLGDGEPGVEKDTGKIKVGDGVTPWTGRPYASAGPQGPAGVADDASVKALVQNPASQTATALSATYVPRWKPNVAYSSGDVVTSPAGDVVTAKSNFTSGATFNAANWNYSAAYASKYASTATKAATAPLLSKLKRGVQDAILLYVGDSTGNGIDEHIYMEMQDLAARFPAYTVTIAFWNETSGTAYQAPITIQTGTGARTLTVWNAAAAGKAPAYLKGSRWAAAVVAIGSPDLICISHGHNMGDPTPTTNGGLPVRWDYLGLTEELALQHPGAGILLMSQNPTYLTGRETWQAQKAQILQEIAAQKGYGFVDVHQAFMDTGAPASYVKSDQIHPTVASDGGLNGSRLWADTVGAALVYSADAAALPRAKSSLTEAAASIVPNVNFTSWASTIPDGWTATNATGTKDTTNFETGTYGLQITAGGASGSAHLELAGGTDSFGLKGNLSGKTITVAARIFVPASYTGTPSLVVQDSGGASQQARADIASDTRDRYMWLIASKKVVSPGSFLKIQLAARLSGTAAGSITVDRIRVVEGDLPRDVVTGTPGPQGAAGTPSGQMDYLSTFGSNPIMAAVGASAGAGVLSANTANFVKIKPHRNMSISVLEWQVHTTGGNYDVGIYAADGTRLWSKGSTATPAAGAVLETVSPAVSLTADTLYWLALTFDSTVPLARGQVIGSANILKLADGTPSASSVGSSFPLPATAAPAGGGQTNRLHLIAVREA